jgi:mono/diheme cytochrome c family protein
MKGFRNWATSLATVLVLLLISQVVFSQGGDGATESPADAASELGYFHPEQVDPGYRVYDEHCAVCHGYNLLSGEMGGPPLTGAFFYNYWAGKSVGDLLEYVRNNMPLGQPRSLTPEQYANVVAYILDYNKFPAGETRLAAESPVLDLPVVQPQGE